jgi:hypothetical protein
VSKHLASKKVDNVEEAMRTLAILLNHSVDRTKDTKNAGSKKNQKNRKTAICQGAHLAVVQAMRQHASSAKVQCRGLFGLIILFDCDMGWDDIRSRPNVLSVSVKAHIMAVGGFKACLEAMKRHDGSSTVQERGCCLIGKLFSFPDLRKKIVDKGGLKAVIHVMEKYENDTNVQREGCFAIKALLHEEEREPKASDDFFDLDRFVKSVWAELVVSVGSIDRITTAMSKHITDAKIQMYGCECFSRLSKTHVDYRSAILRANGLGPVGQAVHHHKDHEQSRPPHARHSMTLVL